MPMDTHHHCLDLSLATPPQPQPQPQPPQEPLNLLETQPQPQPQQQPLNLLETMPEPPNLLEIQPQPQPQTQPQQQPLNLLETNPEPPNLLEIQPQPQPQPRRPELAPLNFTLLPGPSQPSSSSQEREAVEEWYKNFPAPPPFPLPPPPVHSNVDNNLQEMRMLPRSDCASSSSQPAGQSSRRRRLTSKAKIREGKPKTIDPPFPWATNARAKIYTIEHLEKNNMKSISGKVKCKGCQEEYEIEFDLIGKFVEIAMFIEKNCSSMFDRAPEVWTNPSLPSCKRCGQEKALVRPVFNKKRNTNWLFLFLGGMIGCATLSHLKYYCKHNLIHSTAAKDRLVFLAYLDLCKQLAPNCPFDL